MTRQCSCVVLDGGLLDGWVPADRIVSRFVVNATDGAIKAETHSLQVTPANVHASRCAKAILAVAPEARFHSVRVFDDKATPASRLLGGLVFALTLGAQVVCAPSSIGATRLESSFREACARAVAGGVMIVCPWPPGAGHPIPAALPEVVSVSVTQARRQRARGPFIVLNNHGRTVATALNSSGGTAVISGLAALYTAHSDRVAEMRFTDSLDKLTKEIAKGAHSDVAPDHRLSDTIWDLLEYTGRLYLKCLMEMGNH